MADEKRKADWRATPVRDLPLAPRTINALERAFKKTVGDVVDASDGDLLRIPEFGRKSYNEVKEILAKEFNLSPKPVHELKGNERWLMDEIARQERVIASLRANLAVVQDHLGAIGYTVV